MKKNNKGFSLVELIVIIAIMAVLAVSVISYVGMLGKTQAVNCAKELVNHLSQTKVCAMSKSSAYLVIWQNDTGVYVKSVQGGREDVEQIGKAGIVVLQSNTRGHNHTNYYAIPDSEATGLKIEFDRASGALKKDASDNFPCYGFRIQSGNYFSYVELEPFTGKASIR